VNPNEPQTPPTRGVEHAACPVNSFNEWDPLEEVIVGRLEGAVLPGYEPSVTASMPSGITRTLRWIAGWKYPRFVVETAQRQLDNFIHILEAEGVRVRRPDVVPFSRRFKSPFWSSRGYNVANPRDGLLLLGDEILETPMAWRCRYFEMAAYRSLLKEYFAAGARWTAAPRPMLRDELYDRSFRIPEEGEPIRYAINEFEPVFDAADFIRCGRDIFMTRSNVTNALGLEWLRRHVGDRYRIHQLESRCRQPMHIDSSFMPMAPGKVLVNPEYIDVERLPAMFTSWDVLVAPRPNKLDNFWYKLFGMTSKWIGMNILMLDEKRVIVEESQKDMIKAFEGWGFEPIPCSFVHYAFFGGSFHCSTLDVRRRGTLQSYF
jgi:glycine amidinotransferase